VLLKFKVTVVVSEVPDDDNYNKLVIPKTHKISNSKTGNGDDEQRTATYVELGTGI
jgi:hypothetical protein